MTPAFVCGISPSRTWAAMIRTFASCFAALGLAACVGLSAAPGNALSLRAADQAQMLAVSAGDVDALDALAHPDLRINAPTGQILTREDFLAAMRSGDIGAEAFTRLPEDVIITGDIGTVMGSEVFTPTASSALGREYGSVPLQRRYTNIYVWMDGSWRWLARHANVVGTE